MLRDADNPRRQDVYWTGADLVVEVIGEDDPGRDLVTKRLEYAQAGIPEFWIVDPRDRTIPVLHLVGEAYQTHGYFGGEAVATSATWPEPRALVGEVFEVH